jgi:hypothetical protein
MISEHRVRIRRHHLEKACRELEADPVMHGQDKSFALACGILRQFLNEQWIDRHFDPKGKKGFLTLDETTPERREQSGFRLIDLSEVLFNLQDVPGFDECITRLRNGDIEGTYAELDFGRMLYLNKVPFRFVVPQGLKRADYDIEVIYPNGLIACADSKCKIETTEFKCKWHSQCSRRCAQAASEGHAGHRLCKSAAQMDRARRTYSLDSRSCAPLPRRRPTHRVCQILFVTAGLEGRHDDASARLQGSL